MENAPLPNAGPADATAPGAPVGGSPAPSPAVAADPPKNRGGRPKGAIDSKPRKSRVRKSTTDKNAPPRTNATPASGTPDTFDAPTSGAGGAALPPPKATIAIDPKELAQTAIMVGNSLIGVVAGMRYPDAIASTVPLSKDEIDNLAPMLTAYLQQSSVQLDPGVAFLLFAGFSLGMHVLMAESALKQHRELANNAGGLAPVPATAAGGVVDTAAARAAAA